MAQTKPTGSVKPDDRMQQHQQQSASIKPHQQHQQEQSLPQPSKKSDSGPHQPPTQHLHSKATRKSGDHAFGGHSIPRADVNGDPRLLYPKPPYDEHEQQSPAIEGKMTTLPDFGEYHYTGSGKLKDKVCLVTGGDSGIGRAVCLAFARESAKAVCIQHLPVEKSDAAETERIVTAANCGFFAVTADLDTDAACKKMVEAAVGKFGRIDVLVLNAAVQGKTINSITELTEERVRKTFAVNIESMFHTLKHALPHMKPGSCVITTSSIQVFDPSHFIADYACTKAAIANFTQSISRELIERGIRVNSVAPGPVWTPLIVQSFPKEKVAKFGEKAQTPYGRPAQPCEMAPAFVFLANNADSSFVNGTVVSVDGGR